MSKKLLTAFVSAVIDNSTFEEMDTIYLSNRVMALVGETVAEQETEAEQLIDLKDDLVAVAVKNGKIGDTLAEQDILGAELMNLITPAPSQLNQDFWTSYASNPEQAVSDFYQLSQKNDYIKVKAIAKNIAFKAPTAYGDLEITINLSKPEKDPKEIAAAYRAGIPVICITDLKMPAQSFLNKTEQVFQDLDAVRDYLESRKENQ